MVASLAKQSVDSLRKRIPPQFANQLPAEKKEKKKRKIETKMEKKKTQGEEETRRRAE